MPEPGGVVNFASAVEEADDFAVGSSRYCRECRICRPSTGFGLGHLFGVERLGLLRYVRQFQHTV